MMASIPRFSPLWRISNHCTLDGFGGEHASGRWHTSRLGKPVVYMAEHPSLALVESLVNLTGRAALFPGEYQLIKIDVATGMRATKIGHDQLKVNWRDDLEGTRRIGDDWLASAKSALLAVPSAPSPESMNYLLNPLHPDAHKVKTQWCRWIRYDQRLFGINERTPLQS